MEAGPRRRRDGSRVAGDGWLSWSKERRGVDEGGLSPGMFQGQAKDPALLELVFLRAARLYINT